MYFASVCGFDFRFDSPSAEFPSIPDSKEHHYLVAHTLGEDRVSQNI